MIVLQVDCFWHHNQRWAAAMTSRTCKIIVEFCIYFSALRISSLDFFFFLKIQFYIKCTVSYTLYLVTCETWLFSDKIGIAVLIRGMNRPFKIFPFYCKA